MILREGLNIRSLAVLALWTSIALLVAGCAATNGEAEPGPTRTPAGSDLPAPVPSLPSEMPPCPTAYDQLPDLTVELAAGLVGSPLVYCDELALTASGAPVVEVPVDALLAIDGVELPADVVFDGTDHSVTCEKSESDIAVLLVGTWYRAREPICTEFL